MEQAPPETKTGQEPSPQEEVPAPASAPAEKMSILARISAFFASIGVKDRLSRVLLVVFLTAVISATTLAYYLLPPADFPAGKVITIQKGLLSKDIYALFESEHIVRSQTVLKLCAMLSGGDKRVGSGDFLFKEPIGACKVADRLMKGISGIPAVRVTVTEGMTNKQIAELLAPELADFDQKSFIDHAHTDEGYLFPDTYFFATNATAQNVQATMRANFDKKIALWTPIVESAGRNLRDVIIMASILEKEARIPDDQAIVSGILWKRIEKKMPLQVDATFLYLLGKKSSELTAADLQIKSAYNTYKNKGLPAGPIGNPGLLAVEAAVKPKDTPYLYYLSDKAGVMHYAKTFEEHKANKAKYLK